MIQRVNFVSFYELICPSLSHVHYTDALTTHRTSIARIHACSLITTLACFFYACRPIDHSNRHCSENNLMNTVATNLTSKKDTI